MGGGKERAKESSTNRLEVVDGDLVAEEVEEDVLESASVTVGENEPVAVDPLGVLGVRVHEARCGEGNRSVSELSRPR